VGAPCLIDGEAIVSDGAGLAVFELPGRGVTTTWLCSAPSTCSNSTVDLRRVPIEQRKPPLAKLVGRPNPGVALDDHYVGDGDIVFRQACKLGCEDIVSKRLAPTYRSGRSRQWVKVKNPAAPPGRREAEEDWEH
jgi:bifunctional non-homologous end joining protein LigD